MESCSSGSSRNLYLVERKQRVRYGGRCSETSFVDYGVPQGSVLGSILFIMYTADLVALIQQQGLQPYLYANDTQIVGGGGGGEELPF